MSENEIKLRREYKVNRRKWMKIQIVAIVLVAAMALGMFLIYDRMSQTYYIEYTESSKIDYRVEYVPNEFFDNSVQGGGQAYIAYLIKGMEADFAYAMNMGVSNVDFDYKHNVEATLLIADKDTGDAFYTSTDELVPLTSEGCQSKGVDVCQSVDIDYQHYNRIAKDFVNTYNLRNASCTLIVRLNVEVVSTSKRFEQDNENTYSTALYIPLAVDTFSVEINSSVPEGESKILAYKGADSRKVFYVAGIVFSVLAVLQAAALAVYMHLTKNEDVTYAARVRRIVNAYGSFIQRMEGGFDVNGYQVITVKTFTELLGIRDTLQAPILMSENRDETVTQFLIPTSNKLLYVYAIKVDNFDEIYGTTV
jgi:hypothetical protein